MLKLPFSGDRINGTTNDYSSKDLSVCFLELILLSGVNTSRMSGQCDDTVPVRFNDTLDEAVLYEKNIGEFGSGV